jgi:N-acetylmuramoyl-L-alanine amidase
LEAVLNGPKIELSHKLAIDIQSKILGNARQKYNGVQDGGVKPAPFWVLVGAQMPSVLVETGYVTNPTECRRLANADYQDRIAKGIAEGIYNYLLLREKAMY